MTTDFRLDSPIVLTLVFAVLALAGTIITFFFFLALFRPWLRAFTSGTPVPVTYLLGMRFRGNPPDLILSAYTSLMFSGDHVPVHDVESVYIANRGTIRNAQDLIEIVKAEHEG